MNSVHTELAVNDVNALISELETEYAEIQQFPNAATTGTCNQLTLHTCCMTF